MILMLQGIKIRNIKEIEKINQIVSKYSFDIWIHGKSGMADAKSILGMYILQLNEPLRLVVPDDANYHPLFKELEEFIIFE
jgi:phosphotransferase system HPr-like phosphotransfer protein